MVMVFPISPPHFELKSKVNIFEAWEFFQVQCRLAHLFYLDLHETQLEYDKEAAESLMHVDLTLFQEVECSVDSISVDLQITCPRCKTKTSSNERLVVCSNSSCGATYRSKATSVRVELIVTETSE